MKLPDQESFAALGTDWTIKRGADIDLQLSDEEVWAVTDHLDNSIKIRRECDPTYLIHEVIHVIEKAMQMNLDDQDVHLIARGLRAILRENPFLIKEMFA